MKRKKVTMEDIAAELGVSKNSVSVALNGKAGIGEALRQSILLAAHKMQYGAYAYRQTEAGCQYVVMVTPEYISRDTFFYEDVFWAVEQETQSQGCVPVKYIVSAEAQQRCDPPVLNVPLHACRFLVVGILPDPYMRELIGLGVPVVSVDIPYARLNLGCVCTSNFEGGALAAEYLAGQGHRRIGFVGPVHAAESVYQRWCGFREALAKRGLEPDPACCVLGEAKGFALFNTVESIAGYMDGALEAAGAGAPTAWFCAGDLTAVALVNYLSQRGVRIPQDASVMGFDDIAVSQMILPRLTTMRVDRKLMGKLAVQYLLGNHFLSALNLNITLPPVLVERDSVRRLEAADAEPAFEPAVSGSPAF